MPKRKMKSKARSISAGCSFAYPALAYFAQGTKYRKGAPSQLIVVGELASSAGGGALIAMDCGGGLKPRLSCAQND